MLDDQHLRTISLIGHQNHQILTTSSVMIIGLGAVGGYALENLARIGVKNLIVVDFDTFEPSNLNRQILATHKTINHPKTEIAKERILEINPDAAVTTISQKLTSNNLDFITSLKPDFVIDAIDDTTAKIALIEILLSNNIQQ